MTVLHDELTVTIATVRPWGYYVQLADEMLRRLGLDDARRRFRPPEGVTVYHEFERFADMFMAALRA